MLNLKSAKEQMPAINIFRFIAECLGGHFFWDARYIILSQIRRLICPYIEADITLYLPVPQKYLSNRKMFEGMSFILTF